MWSVEFQENLRACWRLRSSLATCVRLEGQHLRLPLGHGPANHEVKRHVNRPMPQREVYEA